MTTPLKSHWGNDDLVEVGLDEAGRRSLWGRLYVGAVILSPCEDVYPDDGVLLRQIKDSKKLTKKKRAVLAQYIRENAIESAVAYAEPYEIDSLNVLRADMATMRRALDSLTVPFQRILVDGDTWEPYRHANTDSETETETEVEVEAVKIVDGDATCLSIAAASILAKEAHDDWIKEMVKREPDLHDRYGIGSNIGYGTATHMAGLQEWGAHKFHRQSFAPVRSLGSPSSTTTNKKGPMFLTFTS